MKNILIGVDIGTSCTKAAITDKDGKILGQASQKYSLLVKQSGWAEQDPKDWEEAVYFTINQAVKTAGISGEQVAGICISGLFAGSGVLVDNKGNPLGNAIIWMDRRAVEESHETEHIIPSHKLFEISGNRNDPYFGFNKILWIKKHRPGQWQNIRWLLSSNGYIVYCLTGNITMDCTSASNIGGIYDQRTGRWSKEVMEKLGIPESLFPEKLMKPEETAGFLTKEAAKKTGLKQGIPVCAGCTDCLASVIASGVVKENVQTAVIGTSINWGIIHRNIP
ncbi:MAG: FGGY family carbohydrate kinase, partial [Lachnoclostridium edouardi]|uniref:FGGY family carbohydrate kinase n=1 Tax=Lachnoclostridium edouardi TaxID=1926283 RepID=UPI0026DBF7C9